MAIIGVDTQDQLTVGGFPRTFNTYNSYDLMSGSVALANTAFSNGMATTLYTGNGTTQSVVTGVDMATQWGNDASEKFGGLVWFKCRSVATSNTLFDSVRGMGKVFSDATEAETSVLDGFVSLSSTGVNLDNTGSGGNVNVSTRTYAAWSFQTTHRTSGTTNHGKAYTCHYNPFTGFTIVKYEGSGLAGHEIPHHLGRKLGLFHIKNLSTTSSWRSFYGNTSQVLELHSTIASTVGYDSSYTNEMVSVSNDGHTNASTNQLIMYGWANSYFDEANTLIGNYEIGIYQGTGAAGNKVQTRGKPAWVMIKRLDSTGDWEILDINRGISNAGNDARLYTNTSSAETNTADTLNILSDGFSLNSNLNASGGQYLYMVVYDNDSGSGKSKYPRATDTSNINITARIPLAQGIDIHGLKNKIVQKSNVTIPVSLTSGKNYIYYKSDDTFGSTPIAPLYTKTISNASMGLNQRGFEFNTLTNTWTAITSTQRGEFLKSSTLDYFGDSSCIAAYNFENNANDLSGTYNGTPTAIAYLPGKFGQAAVFNGSTSGIDTTLNPKSAAFTISMWLFQKDNTKGSQHVFTKQETNIADASAHCTFEIVSGSISYTNEYGASNGTYAQTIPYAIPNQTWTHIVYSINGAGASLYVNGTLVQYTADTNFLTGAFANNVPFMFGKPDLVANSTRFFYGSLDQVRIFNRVLTPTEVVDLANPYSYAYSQEPVNFLSTIIEADQNGQPIRAIQAPKVSYREVIKTKEILSKNALTARVSFDGSTTPCTIKDSYNVKAVIRTATGTYDIYFKDEMKNVNYSTNALSSIDSQVLSETINKVTIGTYTSSTNALANASIVDVHILGGKS